MNDNQNYFTGNVISSYICTTLDGNYISNVGNYFVIWQISSIRNTENGIYIDVVYFTNKNQEIHKIDNYPLDNREIKILLEIKNDYNEIMKNKEEADKMIQEEIVTRLKNRPNNSLVKSLKQYNAAVKEKVDFEEMPKDELLDYISSSEFYKFQDWGRKNDNYLKYVYNRSQLGEYTYRDFMDISSYEILSMLRMINIIGYRCNTKVNMGKYPFLVEWSPYIERAYVGNPFSNGIVLEKDYNKTIINKEWIPEKRGREWDGMDWSSYTIPGYSNETKTTVRESKKGNISFRQLCNAQNYCLRRQIGPEWIKTKKLSTNRIEEL